MMQVQTQVQDAVTPALKAMHARLSGAGKVALMKGLGLALERTLQKHFIARGAAGDSKRAAKGWRRQGIWGGIRRTTAFTNATADKATVTIGDPIFRTKLFGATIKPGPGKKYLAIPLQGIVYGHAPRSAPVAGLFLMRAKRGLYLATGGDEALSKGQARQKRAKNSTIRLYYKLVANAKVPKDERALPPLATMQQALVDAANESISLK